MSDIINLNHQRKAKARNDKDKKASLNRVAFGRTKAQKQTQKKEDERSSKLLDGHKRDKDDE